MENKIVLELILKNLEEIKYLFETMLKEDKPNPLLIEISTLKAKTLYQELRLLLPKDSLVEESDSDLELSDTSASSEDEENKLQDEEEFKDEANTETTFIEEKITIEEKIIDSDDLISNLPEEVKEETEILSSIIDHSELETKEEHVEKLIPETLQHEEIFEDKDIIDEKNQHDSIELKFEENEISDETIEAAELIDIIPETIVETTIITETTTVSSIIIEETISEPIEKKVFGEQFVKEPSLNDKLASATMHESKVKAMPISNIKSAIGLNDRFLFTRELFGNDSSRYELTIDQIDQSNNMLEAIEYLEKNFKWTKNDASLKFMDLLKRRFEKQ